MKFVTIGQGKSIHLAREIVVQGSVAGITTVCGSGVSSWGTRGGFQKVREVSAEAPTCKRCQASVAFQEASQPAAEEPQVVVTRTGNETHSSSDKVTTSCGEKVKSVYGPVGTPIETQRILPNGKWSETYLVPASVSCIKCQQ